MFCGGVGVAEMYSLEELLRASAETLGRGEVGSTYKAVMETGFIVTVKRMREPSAAGAAEFGRRAEELGRVRHPNAVALRAYFQAKEERLLVYDYYPNGSLFSLLHGQPVTLLFSSLDAAIPMPPALQHIRHGSTSSMDLSNSSRRVKGHGPKGLMFGFGRLDIHACLMLHLKVTYTTTTSLNLSTYLIWLIIHIHMIVIANRNML